MNALDFELIKRSVTLCGVKLDRGHYCNIEHRDVAGETSPSERYDKLWYGCLGEAAWERYLLGEGLAVTAPEDPRVYEQWDLWAGAALEVKTRVRDYPPKGWYDFIVADTPQLDRSDYFLFSWVDRTSFTVHLAGWLDRESLIYRGTERYAGERCETYTYPCDALSVRVRDLWEPDGLVVALRENAPQWGSQERQEAMA